MAISSISVYTSIISHHTAWQKHIQGSGFYYVEVHLVYKGVEGGGGGGGQQFAVIADFCIKSIQY